MNRRLFNAFRAVAALGVAAALFTSGNTVQAQGSPEAIVGAWVVTVTLRNCTTGAPQGRRSISLVTFHRGGTLSENPGGTTFAPGQRSGGQGTWPRWATTPSGNGSSG